MNTFEKKNQSKVSYKSPALELVTLPKEDVLTLSNVGEWDKQEPSYNDSASGNFDL